MLTKEWVSSTDKNVSFEINKDDDGVVRFNIMDKNFGQYDIGGGSLDFWPTPEQSKEIAELLTSLYNPKGWETV